VDTVRVGFVFPFLSFLPVFLLFFIGIGREERQFLFSFRSQMQCHMNFIFLNEFLSVRRLGCLLFFYLLLLKLRKVMCVGVDRACELEIEPDYKERMLPTCPWLL
jgi:hypothetical protein